MAKEIERKYLVISDEWRGLSEGIMYRQGYLSSQKKRIVRIRTIHDKGFVTIKGMNSGITRAEYEYEIPLADANEMLDSLCLKPLIEKKRYKIIYEGLTWEVDEFFSENLGLIIAEIELKSEDQKIPKPKWLGEEVSYQSKYFNANLIQHPYITWNKNDE